jgi:iron complex outermembrane receptor protein
MIPVAAGAQATSSSAAVNTAPDTELAGEIIVTAQKREQSLRDVPLSITALGDQSLKNSGVNNISQLQGVAPNVQTSANLGVTSVLLRGIGSSAFNVGGDSSVAYHVDGVYIARQRAQTGGFFDVERLEIIRGPQGDLYGRNATGGSVNVITRRPTWDWSANGRLYYGNYNTVVAEGAVSGPIISDVAAIRIAGIYRDHDGYGKNIVTGNDVDGQHEYGGRVSLDVNPSDALSIKLSADYYRANDSLAGLHYFGQARSDRPLVAVLVGGQVASDVRDIASTRDASRYLKTYGFAGTVDLKLNDSLKLRSITGYRSLSFALATDVSAGSVLGATLDQVEQQHQFSEEIQLIIDAGRLSGLVGAYYFTERDSGSTAVPLQRLALFGRPGFTSASRFLAQGVGKTKAYAAFAHLEYAITDTLKGIAGLRYSDERRSATGSTAFPVFRLAGGTESWNALTPKFVIQYTPNRSLMLFASASKGFKSGGFTLGVPGAAVNPEYLWSYEAGLKTSLLGGVIQANLTGFYYDYKDLVVSRVINSVATNENAAKARIRGFEAELVLRPSRRFRVDASLGYLDAVYRSYTTEDPLFPTPGVQQDLSGNRLNQAPKITLRAAAEYRFPIGSRDLTFSPEILFQDESFFTPFNMRNAYQGSYAIVNGRVGYDISANISLSAYGRNLTNKTVRTFEYNGPAYAGFPRLGVLNEPRTYGVEVAWKF